MQRTDELAKGSTVIAAKTSNLYIALYIALDSVVKNFPFELVVLNHAIHSRILRHCAYFCTVAGPLASAETIQSGTELGTKTSRR